jgi:hypothetical protein
VRYSDFTGFASAILVFALALNALPEGRSLGPPRLFKALPKGATTEMDSWMQIQMSEETWDILGFLMIFHICLEMGFPVYLRKWHLNREKNDESVDFGVPYQ